MGKYSFIQLLLLFMVSSKSLAQFRVVDANDKSPLSCAYIFDEKGHLLGMTDIDGNAPQLKGNVVVSTMSYASETVNASSFHGTLELKPSAFSLDEVAVGGNDFVKTTVVFRDIFRNDSSVVLYREGLKDFYFDTKKQKYTTRVRACRQFEHPDIRKLFGKYPMLCDCSTIDLEHIHYVKRAGVAAENGDTTTYNADFYGRKSDAITYIKDTLHHRYRSIIDDIKLKGLDEMRILEKIMKMRFEKQFIDWTFSDPSMGLASLVGCRTYRRLVFGKKNPIVEETTQEISVISIKAMSKEEAKVEMKEKTISKDYTLPDALVPIPFNVTEDTKDLVERDYWTM